MSNLAYTCAICPENCGDFVMPNFNSGDCVDDYEIELSEIKRILITTPSPTDSNLAVGAPADWTNKAQWASAIDNTAVGKIRSIYGIGSEDEGSDKVITIHDNIQKIVSTIKTVLFKILNRNSENYAAANKFSCGATVRFWYETRGGYLYGGPQGIKATVSKPKDPKNEGADSIAQLILPLVYESSCLPLRIVSPWLTTTPA